MIIDAALQVRKNYLVAAAGTAYAFTAGMSQFKHRNFIREVARHFGHDDRLRGTLPVVRVETLTSSETPVELAEIDAVSGNASLLELLVLARLVRERQPRAIFEVGTFDGQTTLNLAANAPQASVYTLDLPRGTPTKNTLSVDDRVYVEKERSGARFIGTTAAQRITQLYRDSASFDFSPFPSDFVFVDGAHTYDYVLSDSHSAFRLLRNGKGTIVWHDYAAWEGVTRALSELRLRDRHFADIVSVQNTTLAVLDVR